MITAIALLLIPALLMLAIYAIISMRETVRQVRTRPARGFWAERQERKGRGIRVISGRMHIATIEKGDSLSREEMARLRKLAEEA